MAMTTYMHDGTVTPKMPGELNQWSCVGRLQPFSIRHPGKIWTTPAGPRTCLDEGLSVRACLNAVVAVLVRATHGSGDMTTWKASTIRPKRISHCRRNSSYSIRTMLRARQRRAKISVARDCTPCRSGSIAERLAAIASCEGNPSPCSTRDVKTSRAIRE